MARTFGWTQEALKHPAFVSSDPYSLSCVFIDALALQSPTDGCGKDSTDGMHARYIAPLASSPTISVLGYFGRVVLNIHATVAVSHPPAGYLHARDLWLLVFASSRVFSQCRTLTHKSAGSGWLRSTLPDHLFTMLQFVTSALLLICQTTCAIPYTFLPPDGSLPIKQQISAAVLRS
jgi:hypothetical protein